MIRAALGMFVLAAPLLGQHTWVVDVEGNGDFTDLPPAVAAAAPGDTILVAFWSGLAVHWSFTLSKGLTIVGQGLDRALVMGHLVVAGLPANQRVVLRSLQFDPVVGYPARVTVQDCAGAVVLDDLVLDGVSGLMFGDAALVVQSSHRVHLGRCQLTGSAGLVASEASVTCTGSAIFGASVSSGPGAAAPAVAAVGSRLWFANTLLSGGSNWNGGGFAGPGRSGLDLVDSQVVLADGDVIGGAGFGGFAPGVTFDAASSVEHDAASWVGGGISGTGVVATVETGILTGGIPPPTIGTITLDAAPGAFGLLLLSLPGPGVATPFGPCWLGWLPAPLACGPVPVARTLPPLGFLPHGFALTFQGVVLHGGRLRLSTPLVTTAP
ncbi:MAG: hypothetical protein JNM25_14940 [Planctomycetes bacterium]|nr:hypothetical protein [Planctomycetota bacterium]